MEQREPMPLVSRLVFADSAVMASAGREQGPLDPSVMETRISWWQVVFF